MFFFTTEDFHFVKSLSKVGIFTIIKKYDTRINMRRFLNTETWTLGVVVDLRCQNKSAVAIFAEVFSNRLCNIFNSVIKEKKG